LLSFFFGGEILSCFNKEIGKILGNKNSNEISTKFTIFGKISPKFQLKKKKKKRKKERKKKNTMWGAEASYFGNSPAPRELSDIMCAYQNFLIKFFFPHDMKCVPSTPKCPLLRALGFFLKSPVGLQIEHLATLGNLAPCLTE
jgi:hypothetical protein